MSLLQRAPIDVHASIGCTRAPEHLYRSTYDLLMAGQTLRPYVGALVRRAVTKPERAAILEAAPDGEAAVRPKFLEPINRAIADAWPHMAIDPRVGFRDMELDAFTAHPDASWHFDQDIRADGLPHYGPITAIAVLEGSMKYQLAVSRKDAFDPANSDYFDDETEQPRLVRQATELTANTGDILLFTNFPATYHAGQSVGDSLCAIYYSHLSRIPVE